MNSTCYEIYLKYGTSLWVIEYWKYYNAIVRIESLFKQKEKIIFRY